MSAPGTSKAFIPAEPAGTECLAGYLRDGEHHRWTLPSAGMEVCLDLSALERLARDTAAMRKGLRPGEQIGGLLLGRRDCQVRDSIRIKDVESVSAAGLYQALATMSRRHAGKSGDHSIVGWYRISPEDGLGFTRQDEALMQSNLLGRDGLLLLLRPSDSAPSAMRLVFKRAGELRFASAGFPALRAAAAARVEPRVTPADSRRGWQLAGITVAAALAAFAGGLLWNPGAGRGAVPPRVAMQPVTPAPATPVLDGRFSPDETIASEPVRKAAPPPFRSSTADRSGPGAGKTEPSAPGSEPSAQAAAQVGRLVPPVAIHQPEPVIPADVGSQIPGTVVIGVKVTIDESGRVVDAQPLDDNGAAAGLLLQPALDAARRWRYLAAVADGRPVRSTSTIRFTFRPRR